MDRQQVYDPLRKKMVPLTPEERVRQWFIGVLHNDFGVPFEKMNAEVGMQALSPLQTLEGLEGAKEYRADIVVYGRTARPVVIVECKRPEVPIDKEVAFQAMRYDMVLGARFLVLTNGDNTMILKRCDNPAEGFRKVVTLPSWEELRDCAL